MQMQYPYYIQKQLDEENYQEQCTVCCCIPLYFFNCGFKLGFYRNGIIYAQPLVCGFYNFNLN
jgi:hypothetical protein